MTISLCMIVKNEEEILERVLSCAQEIAEEIIIVDTGSTDGTKEVAARFTGDIFDFEWTDDFAAARNFAFFKAGCDYLMWLDADDYITPKNIEAIKQLKRENRDVDTFMLKYAIAFDADGSPTFSYYRERIMRNSPLARWNGFIHEAVTPFGRIEYADICIEHHRKAASDPVRNLKIYENALAKGETLDARGQFYYARELYYNGLYRRAADAFESFLDCAEGWYINKIEACRMLAYCLYRHEEDARALSALLRSFSFGAPSAESCCDLGKHFLDRDDLQSAIFWYRAALNCVRPDISGAFVSEDCYGFLPYLQLCLCYFKQGDNEAARKYNELAAEIHPNDQAVIHNREYFSIHSNN